MTLDEEIKHCEEVAEENEKECKLWEGGVTEAFKQKEEKLRKCASEHRQLASWLKELKALNENDDVKDVFKNCDTCKYKSLEPDDFPCDRCCHRYINQYVYDDKREVNADED